MKPYKMEIVRIIFRRNFFRNFKAIFHDSKIKYSLAESWKKKKNRKKVQWSFGNRGWKFLEFNLIVWDRKWKKKKQRKLERKLLQIKDEKSYNCKKKILRPIGIFASCDWNMQLLIKILLISVDFIAAYCPMRFKNVNSFYKSSAFIKRKEISVNMLGWIWKRNSKDFSEFHSK